MRKLPRAKSLCTTAGVSALAGIIILGCSPQATDRVKRFFFEVPEEPSPPARTAGSQTAGEPSEPAELATPAPRFASVHHPYAARECDACHDASARMHVRPDLRAACSDCHEDFFGDQVKHDPVSSGDCVACHEPHRSTHPALLRQAVFDTCTECHDEPEDLSQPAHAADNVNDCTACHDAHFGGEHLLKEGIAAGVSKESP